MRIVIAAVGRLKAGPDRALFERYFERLGQAGRRVGLGPCSLSEIAESRATDTAARMAEEAQRLVAALPERAVAVLLDARGKAITSAGLAELMRARQAAGTDTIAFLIGGADGHGPQARAAAHLTLSLGAITLPHGLARIVLAEQLYRCAAILSGHPYHRQ